MRASGAIRAGAAALATLVVATGFATVTGAPAGAAPGDLDPSWGEGGRASEVLGAFSGGDVAIAPDGKVVSVGVFTSTPSFVVTRWNSDGTLDRTFGATDPDGVPTGSRVVNAGGTTTEAYAAVQSDGQVVVAGRVETGSEAARIKVFRLDRDGALDTTFGTDGFATVNPGNVDPVFPLGGQVVIEPGSPEKILVAGSARVPEPGYPLFSVTRLDLGGALDPSFGGGDGVAYADFGQRAIVQDLDRHPTTGDIVATGHTGAPGGGDDAALALFREDGTLYGPETSAGAGPWGQGTLRVDQVPGVDDHAAAVAVDPTTGDIATTGGVFTDPVAGVVTLLGSDGVRQNGFASGGTYVSRDLLVPDAPDAIGTDIDFDGSGRLLVSGTSSGRPGIARLLTGTEGDPHDTTFASTGGTLAPCGSGAADGVAIDPTGRPLLGGSCGGNTVEVYRYLAADDAPAAIAITDVQADTSAAAARRLGLSIEDIDREAFATRVAGLQSTPLKNTPLKNTPLKNTPLKNTPLKNTPLKNTPLKNTTIPILLSDIPIERAGGWEAVLVGTPYEGLPPHTVTIQQLLAVDPQPPALASLTLDEIDLSATPLKNTSITGTLLGLAPLSALPAPATGGWCTYLAGQPLDCSNGVDPARATITDLEVAGDDLAAFYAQPIAAATLQALPPGTPLLDIALDDMSLADLAGADGITHQEAPSLFACESSCDPGLDLVSAQANRQVDPDATIADLFGTQSGHGVAPTLAELIVALIPADEFPYESVPVAELFGLADEAEHPVTYTIDLTTTCAPDGETRLRIELPDGAEPDPSTTVLSGGEVTYGHSSDGSDGELRMRSSDLCDGSPTLSTYTFSATADTALGVDDITVVGEVGGFVLDVESEVPEYQALASDTRSGAHVDSSDGREPDDGEPPVVTDDVLYTGHVGAPGDIDYFTLPAPTAGSTVTVLLSQLPADYDLVLYGPESADTVSTPLRNTPLKNTPLKNTPVEDDGIDPAGNVLVPETLQDVPLKNTPLKNTSINRDTTTEVVTTVISEREAGSDLTVQVSGYDGAASPDPYLLRVRVDDPEPDLPCVTRDHAGVGTPGTIPDVPPGTETLILVNQERLGQVYATSAAGVAAVADAVTRLQTLAARDDVRGVVVPVEGDAAVASAYDAWDAAVCSVDAANEVVASINGLVDRIRTDVTALKHVVLVGSDEIIPQARLVDQVTLSNQRDYRHDAAFAGKDNAISRAFARGYLLSDEPYGDFDPSPFLADALYLADVGLGRLVETPQEISASIDRFIEADGALDLGSSYTAGYDFLKDGALQVDGALRRQGAAGPQSRIDDTWTAADVRAALDDASDPRALSVNAHYDHFRALPAADDPSTPERDLLFSSDLRSSGIPTGSLLFTMGCEGGLNIADVLVPLGPNGVSAPESQDWAQVTAQKGGSFIGNTGYGYGDTEIVAYSEQVYAELARRLDGTATVGQALSLAKHGVVADIGVPGVYDAKALQEATLYGLPMFRIGDTGQSASSFMPEPDPTTPPTVDTQAVDFDVDATAIRRSTAEGDHWQVPGEPLVINHHRPVQPASTIDIAPVAGKRVHGVLVTELTSTDIGGVDPVEVRPTIDLGAHEPKHQIEEVLFPTTLTNLTRTSTATGRVDRLVALTGQFFTDGSPADGGVQRLFTHVGGQVLHSDDFDDFAAPTVERVEAATVAGSALFSAQTSSDAERVFVLYREEGSPAWRPLDLAAGGAGAWGGATPLVAGGDEITEWFVQVVDAAGNVGISTNKGRYYQGGPVPPTPSALRLDPGPSSTGYYPDGVVVSLVGATGDPAASVSIDGSDFAPSDGSEVISGDGLHTVVFRVGGEELTALVPIDAAPPTVTITYPAVGQVLTPSSSSTPVFSCADGGSGIASCTPEPATLDLSPGTHTLDVTAVDRVGRSTTESRTYTVEDPGRIVFTSTRDGNAEIYAMRPDGSGLTRLTNHAAVDADAVQSPDGSRIAFTSTRDGNVEVYVMRADGSAVTRLTNHSKVDTPASWSPDGARIAFTSTRDGNSEIYTMEADGSDLKRLTNHRDLDANPVWSPDGTKIAFTSTRHGNAEIYTLSATAGGTPTRLTSNSAADVMSSWSSTGRLAFTSHRDGNAEIYSMTPTGTGVTRLTNHPRVDQTSSWSPDGTKLVFSSNRDGSANFELYTMSATGSGVTRITDHRALDTLPDW